MKCQTFKEDREEMRGRYAARPPGAGSPKQKDESANLVPGVGGEAGPRGIRRERADESSDGYLTRLGRRGICRSEW